MNKNPICRFRTSHEYAVSASSEGIVQKSGGEFYIGISDHAQHSLGDIVFVELPLPGTYLRAGEVFGVVESVKAASDLYAPLSGKVIATNEKLKQDPGLVNKSPYEEGWLLRIVQESSELATKEWNELMDADEYAREIGSEGKQ